jgi:hypothetical protein
MLLDEPLVELQRSYTTKCCNPVECCHLPNAVILSAAKDLRFLVAPEYWVPHPRRVLVFCG